MAGKHRARRNTFSWHRARRLIRDNGYPGHRFCALIGAVFCVGMLALGTTVAPPEQPVVVPVVCVR